MDRRTFLINTAKAAGLGIAVAQGLPLAAVAASPAAWQKTNQRLLTGREKPNLAGDSFKLQKAAATAFTKMRAAAKKEGFDLHCVSSYRSYAHQKSIWERKYKRFISEGYSPGGAVRKIVEYSTVPGTSRHHWGTDFDVVDKSKRVNGGVLRPELFSPGQPFGPLKQWLNKNAARFGFAEVYTSSPGRRGFKYEPWHFSFSLISVPLLQAYRNLDMYSIIQNKELSGYEALTRSFADDYINEHILDINPQLLSPRGNNG